MYRVRRHLPAMRWLAAFFVMACWSTAAPGACEKPSPLSTHHSAHAATIIDGRTLYFADGRTVLLAGVRAPPAYTGDAAIRAHELLTAIAADAPVVVDLQSRQPDRYGRFSAMIWREGDATSLQQQLIEAGLAVVGAESDQTLRPECLALFLASEKNARDGKLGLWRGANAIKNAESPGDIVPLLGQFAMVEGDVQSVRESGGLIYLNFSRRWRDGFAAVLPRRLRKTFESKGLSLEKLHHRRIRVRGWIELRNGPRLSLTWPEQIEVVDAPSR